MMLEIKQSSSRTSVYDDTESELSDTISEFQIKPSPPSTTSWNSTNVARQQPRHLLARQASTRPIENSRSSKIYPSDSAVDVCNTANGLPNEIINLKSDFMELENKMVHAEQMVQKMMSLANSHQKIVSNQYDTSTKLLTSNRSIRPTRDSQRKETESLYDYVEYLTGTKCRIYCAESHLI